MPALNFSAQFATLVEDGIKCQTIRAPRKDGRAHCKVGDTIKLYTGMRTKSCRLLRTARVTRIDAVNIGFWDMALNGSRLIADLYKLPDSQSLSDSDFAKADGFPDYATMCAWFDKTHGLPFHGSVIYWR